MDLLRKVRTLFGALVHKPFTDSTGHNVPNGASQPLATDEEREQRTPAVTSEELPDRERVADLLGDQLVTRTDSD